MIHREQRPVPDLYSLVGRDVGPVATFLTREEAEADLAAVLHDERGWEGDVWVEAFELDVAGEPR